MEHGKFENNTKKMRHRRVEERNGETQQDVIITDRVAPYHSKQG